MFIKTAGLIVIFIAIWFGLEISNIYVSTNFEKPIEFKFKYLILKLSSKLAQLAAYFNYGNEFCNLRFMIKCLNDIVRSNIENIEIRKTIIENVSVSIYSVISYDKINASSVVIYFHGGFYIFGSSDEYDLYLSKISKRLNTLVISVKLAPEFPYPAAINDCYLVTKYILTNPNEFNIDPNKIILAGDSAGGNALAVVTQKLLLNNNRLPQLQILIYPRTQMMNFLLPSYINYENTGIAASFNISPRKFNACYLGIKNITKEIEQILASNAHTSLVDSIELQNRIIESLDVNKIPDEYKLQKSYYDNYKTQKKVYSFGNPFGFLKDLNKETISLLKNAFSVDVSPILAHINKLRGLPKAYFIILEWDSLKDEGLLYAEKLKSAGVNVTVKLYKDAFHGIAPFVDTFNGYKVARQMLDDLIVYIKNNL